MFDVFNRDRDRDRDRDSIGIFEPQTATGSEHFARQNSGLSQIFKLVFFITKKRLNNVNVVV